MATFMAFPGSVILEEFNRMATLWTGFFKNRSRFPISTVLTGTFHNVFPSILNGSDGNHQLFAISYKQLTAYSLWLWAYRLSQYRFQIFIRCRNGHQIKIFDQDIQNIGCNKRRQARPQTNVFDTQVKKCQQYGTGFLFVP